MRVCLAPGEHHPRWPHWPSPLPMQPTCPSPALPTRDAAPSSCPGSPSPWGATGRASTPEPRRRGLASCRELPRPRGDEPGLSPPRGAAAAGAGVDALVSPDEAGHKRRDSPSDVLAARMGEESSRSFFTAGRRWAKRCLQVLLSWSRREENHCDPVLVAQARPRRRGDPLAAWRCGRDPVQGPGEHQSHTEAPSAGTASLRSQQRARCSGARFALAWLPLLPVPVPSSRGMPGCWVPFGTPTGFTPSGMGSPHSAWRGKASAWGGRG